MIKHIRTAVAKKTPPRGRDATSHALHEGQRGVIQCPRCKNVYFKKRWFVSAEAVQKKLEHKVEIAGKKICGACQMIEDHLFAGEILVKGCSASQQKEVMQFVTHFVAPITAADPQHRVGEIKKINAGLSLGVTEIQLAKKLEKKIRQLCPDAEIKATYQVL